MSDHFLNSGFSSQSSEVHSAAPPLKMFNYMMMDPSPEEEFAAFIQQKPAPVNFNNSATQDKVIPPLQHVNKNGRGSHSIEKLLMPSIGLNRVQASIGNPSISSNAEEYKINPLHLGGDGGHSHHMTAGSFVESLMETSAADLSLRMNKSKPSSKNRYLTSKFVHAEYAPMSDKTTALLPHMIPAMFVASSAANNMGTSILPPVPVDVSSTGNEAEKSRRRKIRSSLSEGCIELMKRYKRDQEDAIESGDAIPLGDRSEESPSVEDADSKESSFASSTANKPQKLRANPREWRVIRSDLTKEESVQYLKYHRWKEPVTNAPKGSGCRVSQCAIHTKCTHLLKMRLTNNNDLFRYTVEECGEHGEELSNHNQGLHDFVLEDVDALLYTGASPPDVLTQLKRKYITENNITLLALLPDEPSKIRHRKLTLLKNHAKPEKFQPPPELSNFPWMDKDTAVPIAMRSNLNQIAGQFSAVVDFPPKLNYVSPTSSGHGESFDSLDYVL